MWTSMGKLQRVSMVCLLLSLCAEVSRSRGLLELQLVSVDNARGELSSHDCCDGGERRAPDYACAGECASYVRVCLKEDQPVVSTTSACTYGTAVTGVLGGNNFHIKSAKNGQNRNSDAGKIIIPFQFSWPRAFTLIVDVRDWNNGSHNSNDERLIERSIFKGMMYPGEEQRKVQHRGASATMEYTVQVRCNDNYYSQKCNKVCRPRDDYFGHYDCDHLGNLRCLDGWSGAMCNVAICKPGCSLQHGTCTEPGECKCNYGWKGALCDRCLTYPGCGHRTFSHGCEKNWGGELCDKDQNYCGTNRPCQHGGICSNTEPNEYHCACRHGYSGKTCEFAEHACMSNPCASGGTCHEVPSGFQCHCPAGWAGPTCALDDFNDCNPHPCHNGGACVDGVNWFRCECLPGFDGPDCRINVDECQSSPCVAGSTCMDQINGYHCLCAPGRTGPRCREVAPGQDFVTLDYPSITYTVIGGAVVLVPVVALLALVLHHQRKRSVLLPRGGRSSPHHHHDQHQHQPLLLSRPVNLDSPPSYSQAVMDVRRPPWFDLPPPPYLEGGDLPSEGELPQYQDRPQPSAPLYAPSTPRTLPPGPPP